MKTVAWICLFLLSHAAIAGPSGVRQEASMVVTGWVVIAQDGNVLQYTLDQPEKLDKGVVNLIGQTTRTWKFQPIVQNGKPIVAKAKMNLRVVASQLAGDQYALRVSGASFGDGESDDVPSYLDRKPPRYPFDAIKAGAEGTVYLALEVDKTGHVEQAVAQQVNLREWGTDGEMRALRRAFADASVQAAKQWTFAIPAAGAAAAQEHWTVRVPVNFNLVGSPNSKRGYGQWDAYIPGPIQPIPWEQDRLAGDDNADAVADDGTVFAPDKRFSLVKPAGG